MESFRHLGQKIRAYPQRRPRAGGERRLTAEEDRVSPPMEHREIMIIVGTVVVFLALGLLAALVTLGLVWV